jgi:hypothetical protein
MMVPQYPAEADVQRPGWVRLDGVLPLGQSVPEPEVRNRLLRLLGIEPWDGGGGAARLGP